MNQRKQSLLKAMLNKMVLILKSVKGLWKNCGSRQLMHAAGLMCWARGSVAAQAEFGLVS